MSYIGNQPTTGSFPFDQFTGNGATTAFTLTYAPAGPTSVIIAISGVVQNPNNYSVVGQTLTFSPAPPSGTNNISVLYLGLPVIGVAVPGNTAFLSSTDLTASAGQTVFAPVGSYTPGFVQVYRNGVHLGDADFTATNGTTVTLANAATAGDLVTIQYYTLTSLTNALPLTGGTVVGSTTFNAGVNLAAISGNVGIGTSSPAYKLDVQTTATGTAAGDNTVGFFGSLASGRDANIRFGDNVNASARIGYLSGALYMYTSGAERVRIDTAGRVTMPYQPCFYAYTGGVTSIYGVVRIDFLFALVNTGSCWNTSTSRFTAPVSGKYAFQFMAMSHNNGISNRYGLYKNGSIYGAQLYASSQQYENFSGNWIVDMASGDFIEIVSGISGEANVHPDYRALTGYLIG
jgi:hypothetical protein